MQAVLASSFGSEPRPDALLRPSSGRRGSLIVVFGAGISPSSRACSVGRQRRSRSVEHRAPPMTFQLMSGISSCESRRPRTARTRSGRETPRRCGTFVRGPADPERRRSLQRRLPIPRRGPVRSYIGIASRRVPHLRFLVFNVGFALFLGATAAAHRHRDHRARDRVRCSSNLKPILTSVPEVDDTKGDPGELARRDRGAHGQLPLPPDEPPVLDDVSFHVRPGQFVALVGPSRLRQVDAAAAAARLRVARGRARSSTTARTSRARHPGGAPPVRRRPPARPALRRRHPLEHRRP